MRLYRKIFLLAYLFCIFIPLTAWMQADKNDIVGEEQVFKAKVIKILGQSELDRENGSKAIQQNLLLKGLEKEWLGKEFEYHGISDIDVASANTYKMGDKVIVSAVKTIDGKTEYYVIDFVRTGALICLAIIFALVIIIIGRKKGIKALVSLIISYFVIILFIIPRILNGQSPLITGVIGAMIILTVIIYITEGWKIKSHISVASVFLSLSAIFILSLIFTYLTRLTGLAQEEAVFLLGTNIGQIDFKGLLLAGILIGAVGVLDDVIIAQVESVKQIRIANPALTNGQIFKAAYSVGNTHLGAIVNTLFLTYTGASLPLLLLFYANPSGLVSFGQAVNNETIATEIVRTFVGSIGVALAMPISTWLAVLLLKETKSDND